MTVRLWHPWKYKRAAHALAAAEPVLPIGAKVEPHGNGWSICIDTRRPEAVERWLSHQMPGVTWERAELPPVLS